MISTCCSPVKMPISIVLTFWITVAGVLGAEPRLADRRIPQDPPASISFPIETQIALNRLQEALMRAGARSGVEQAPWGGAENAGPVRHLEIRLNGRRVGEVLDEFVAFDPRYEWRESEGQILLRP